MPSDLVVELVAIVLLILANGVFSGAEIALVSVRNTRLRELIAQGSGNAQAALALKQQPEHLLATVQIGITVVSATAAAVGGATSRERLAPVIAHVPWIGQFAEPLSLFLVIAFVSYLSVVLGELVPKSLALRSADTFALWAARPLLWLSRLLRPLVTMLTGSSNALLGDRTKFGEAGCSREELSQLVDDVRRSGGLHARAAEITVRALEFPSLTAFDVMVPRQRVLMLPRSATWAELQRLLLEQPHARYPVHSGKPDDVVGYVHLKDIVACSCEQRAAPIEALLRPAYFVPRSASAVDLLSELQQRHTGMAIVLEESGGFAGIITLSDLLAELVGDLASEHTPAQRPVFQQEADGAWLLSGSVPVREVNRALELKLPEHGQWTTLAGLLLERARRIPKKGDRARLPDGLELEVVSACDRKVGSVRLRKLV
jgi:putative hemolysin